MNALETLAAKLYADTYATHGLSTLLCDACRLHEVVVDADGVGTTADTAKLAKLIEHTRYDHATPRYVIVELHRDAFNTRELDELMKQDEAEQAIARDAAGLAPRDSFNYGR